MGFLKGVSPIPGFLPDDYGHYFFHPVEDAISLSSDFISSFFR